MVHWVGVMRGRGGRVGLALENKQVAVIIASAVHFRQHFRSGGGRGWGCGSVGGGGGGAGLVHHPETDRSSAQLALDKMQHVILGILTPSGADLNRRAAVASCRVCLCNFPAAVYHGVSCHTEQPL